MVIAVDRDGGGDGVSLRRLDGLKDPSFRSTRGRGTSRFPSARLPDAKEDGGHLAFLAFVLLRGIMCCPCLPKLPFLVEKICFFFLRLQSLKICSWWLFCGIGLSFAILAAM